MTLNPKQGISHYWQCWTIVVSGNNRPFTVMYLVTWPKNESEA